MGQPRARQLDLGGGVGVVGTEDEGTLTLGEFGEEQDITAPEDPLDLTELGG